MVETCSTLWSFITSKTEFWSAILGAVVGGLIAYMIQVTALREGRKQRDDDHKRLQQSLGNALLIKMIRIHSNLHGIHQHIEGCFAEAARKKIKGEPWQFVLPLANPPDPVHFGSEEMGMLLGLKNDNVLNLILPMDVIHNSLIEVVKALNVKREALTERLKANEADGDLLSGNLDNDQIMALRPRMIVVNSLIKGIRDSAKKDLEESDKALNGLWKMLRDNLDITYKLEFKEKPKDQPASERSEDASTPPG